MKPHNVNNMIEVFLMEKIKVFLALLLGVVSMFILGACGPIQTTTTFVKPTTENPIITTKEKHTTTQNTTHNDKTDNNTTS